jgi:hypothetical protein
MKVWAVEHNFERRPPKVLIITEFNKYKYIIENKQIVLKKLYGIDLVLFVLNLWPYVYYSLLYFV